MTDTHAEPRCLVCDRTQELTPLVPLQYRTERTWICPQHLPILIHDSWQESCPAPRTCARPITTTDPGSP
jgi:hypothetical protein